MKGSTVCKNNDEPSLAKFWLGGTLQAIVEGAQNDGRRYRGIVDIGDYHRLFKSLVPGGKHRETLLYQTDCVFYTLSSRHIQALCIPWCICMIDLSLKQEL